MPPPKTAPIKFPKNDPEWEALEDDEVDRLLKLSPQPGSPRWDRNWQRVNSEAAARAAKRELRQKLEELRNPYAHLSHWKLAINCYDLELLPVMLRAKYLFDKDAKSRLDLEHTVEVERDRMESTRAAVFCCDLFTAGLVVDLIRSECRRSDDELIRAYINKKASWQRVLNNQVLTVTVPTGSNDPGNKVKVILNPKIFPPLKPKEDDEPYVPPDEGDSLPPFVFGRS